MVEIDGYDVREGLYYHPDHFWAKVEDGKIRVGASDYGQKSLKEIVFVELPEEGDSVTKDEPYGTVESVKAVVDLVAPVSGTIAAVNGELSDNPAPINEDPYGEGWLILIDPSNLDDALTNLMDYDAAVVWYRKVVKED